MLSLAQSTFHHNPRLRGPVSSYYNILRVLMTTFIIRLVAILYRLLMAIIRAHFELKFSSYYSN